MRHSFTISLISIGLLFSFPVLAQEKISSPADRCSKAKSDHLAAEHEWSSINADVSFFREELERFRNLRWEIKITLSVLDDALKMIKEKGSLTEAQRLTLNSRIPNNKGIINPDGPPQCR